MTFTQFTGKLILVLFVMAVMLIIVIRFIPSPPFYELMPCKPHITIPCISGRIMPL